MVVREVSMKTIELEKLLFRIINFINKEETVNVYTFKNIFDNVSFEFNKENYNIKIYRNNYTKVTLKYLFKHKDKKYLINYNNLKKFVYQNVTNDKQIEDIIEGIDSVYLDTLPNGEFDEILNGNIISDLLNNLRICNIESIENFEVFLVE